MTWHESDHPRNPKDSPNGTGGKFAVKDATGDDFDLVDAYDTIPRPRPRVSEPVCNGIIDGLRRHARTATVIPLPHDAGIVVADPRSGRAMLATPVMDGDVRVKVARTARDMIVGGQDPAHLRRFPDKVEHRCHVEYRPLPRLDAGDVESLRRGGACPPPLEGGFDAPHAWTDDDVEAGEAVETEDRWPDVMDMDMVPDWEQPPQWERWAVNRVEAGPEESGVFARAEEYLSWEGDEVSYEDYRDAVYIEAFRFYGPDPVMGDVRDRWERFRR